MKKLVLNIAPRQMNTNISHKINNNIILNIKNNKIKYFITNNKHIKDI